jgi:hypothetical protein
MKMKNFYNVWKKYLLKEDVQATEANLKVLQDKLKSLENEKNNVKALIDATSNQLNTEKQQERNDAAQKKTPIPTTPTLEEFVTTPEGTMANTPISVIDEEDLTEKEMEEASGCHEGMEEGGSSCQLELEYQDMDEEKACNECAYCRTGNLLTEAKYKGRTVPLGKPMRGDVKKFKVFVRDPKTGNVKKVNFGDKKMRIKKSNPKRRKSFRARHRCANPGPRTKARYWSCRKW